MGVTGPNSHQGPSSHDRLNGWKEISGYVGKSVRTAQRWERKLGLPVHRLHTPCGQIVYGFGCQIDTWQTALEGRVSAGATESTLAARAGPVAGGSEAELLDFFRACPVERTRWPALICAACQRLSNHGGRRGGPRAAKLVALLERVAGTEEAVVAAHARLVLDRLHRQR